MIDAILAAAVGAFCGYLATMNLSFSTVFIFGILFKNLTGLIIYYFTDPNQIQNVVYRTTHTIWNLAIVRLLFILIFNVFQVV